MALNITKEQRRAIEVRDKLEVWCNDQFDGDYAPQATIFLANTVVQLSIGDILVWCSESGYADGRSTETDGPIADYCQSVYRYIIGQLTPRDDLPA